MALAEQQARADLAPSLDGVRDLVSKVRRTVEGLVFTSSPASLGSVTQLLATLPPDVCERLCAAVARLPVGELQRSFSAEDQLLVDMVRAMYDNLRVGPRTTRVG